VTSVLFAVAYLLIFAKLGAEIASRFFKQPPVLGELLGGMAAAPLLAMHLGPEFAADERLGVLAEMAVIVLLFRAGLETDVKAFLRAGPMAFAVAAAGVAAPFAAGAWLTHAAGLAPSATSPEALFMGAALTATSVGITARVLGDLGALRSRAGTWVLAAAVIDDVLGILVVALLGARGQGGEASSLSLAWAGAKALLGWVGLTAACLAGAPYVDRALRRISPDAGLGINLALAMAAAVAAHLIGLAPIIGAYAAGLGFAGRHVARTMDRELDGVAHFLVPLFFAFTGAQVSFAGLSGMAGFVIALLAVAALTKVVACGGATRLFGGSAREALTVGIGMIPRGEVALVVAGMGLAARVISHDLFSATVVVALATTLLTPPLLAWAWRRQAAAVGVVHAT
jgi:Kef-type K+ transport system membrane component KefB